MQPKQARPDMTFLFSILWRNLSKFVTQTVYIALSS